MLKYDCGLVFLAGQPSFFSILAAQLLSILLVFIVKYEGWNFNSGNYLFTTDTK